MKLHVRDPTLEIAATDLFSDVIPTVLNISTDALIVGLAQGESFSTF
jgi:hypothetical protein